MYLKDFRLLKKAGCSTKEMINYGNSKCKTVSTYLKKKKIEAKNCLQPYKSTKGCKATKETGVYFLYILFIPFLYLIHIIFIAFLYHFYILFISFLYLIYIIFISYLYLFYTIFMHAETTFLTPIGKNVATSPHYNVYRTPKKYKTKKNLKSKYQQSKHSPAIKQNRKHVKDPFLQFPTHAKKADIYTFENIPYLTVNDVNYLNNNYPNIYKDLQNYLLTKHSKLYNHCMNIREQTNRQKIIV